MSTAAQPATRPLDDWRPFAFWAVLGVTILAIFAIGATDAWVAALATDTLLTCLAILCIGCTLQHQPLPWHPLLSAGLAFGLLIIAQIAFGWTTYPGATWTGLGQIAGPAAALYLALYAFRTSRLQLRLARAAWWATLAISVEAIFQHFLSRGYIYGLRDATYATPTGPYVYHNHFAGCMDLLLPLALAAVFLPQGSGPVNPQKRVLRFLSPALGFAAVIISGSRGGILSLLAESLLALAIYRRAVKMHWKTVLGGTIGLAGVLFASNSGTIWHRFLNLGQGDISSGDRLQVWQSCVAIWRAFPWHGCGFNTFASVYPQYQIVDFGKTVVHAHNEYAQALAETGALGAAVVLAFVALFVVGFLRGPARGATGLVRRAEFIGAAGLLAHSVIDFQFHNPANALLFFLVTGAAAAKLDQARSLRSSAGPVVRLARHLQGRSAPKKPLRPFAEL